MPFKVASVSYFLAFTQYGAEDRPALQAMNSVVTPTISDISQPVWAASAAILGLPNATFAHF